MENKESEEFTQHEKNHLFVAEKLDKELCEILAGKIAKKDGMTGLVKDVLDLRMRPDGSIMSVKKALKMLLETANEIGKINELATQEYNIVLK